MTRPYIGNLIIDFSIKDTSVVTTTTNPTPIDPLTGNPLNVDPTTGNVTENTILYRVKAYVKGFAKRGIPYVIQEIGSNPDTIRVTGNIVETWNNTLQIWENNRILPVEILRYQSEATAIYIDPESDYQQIGYFTMAPGLDALRPRVAKRLAKRLGSHIVGNFRF